MRCPPNKEERREPGQERERAREQHYNSQRQVPEQARTKARLSQVCSNELQINNILKLFLHPIPQPFFKFLKYLEIERAVQHFCVHGVAGLTMSCYACVSPSLHRGQSQQPGGISWYLDWRQTSEELRVNKYRHHFLVSWLKGEEIGQLLEKDEGGLTMGCSLSKARNSSM